MASSRIKPFKTVWIGHLNISICAISQNKEILIIKIDFKKAFDMVDYKAIINMLKHLGFGERFISWITNILSSASTSIILNGVPRKTIRCTRGVGQGDPLYHLCYLLLRLNFYILLAKYSCVATGCYIFYKNTLQRRTDTNQLVPIYLK
jgi:hypothetical protein